MTETLGVLAHRGGLLVQRPELSVGVVQAVSRPSGLEVELLARRPLDRRSATERQADIRAGRDGVPAAPRVLLPPHDEGLDLRVGWLDAGGAAHWELQPSSLSGGDPLDGTNGPFLRSVLRFPPMFDELSVVLAWPEIGFPETVVTVPLPDRATVERETVPVWQAPLASGPAPDQVRHRVAAHPSEYPALEAGRVVAGPRVVSRDEHAAVVLDRVTDAGPVLYLGLSAFASGATAGAVVAAGIEPIPRALDEPDDADRIRRRGPAPAVAVIVGDEAFWYEYSQGCSAGGDADFAAVFEFALARPDDDVLDLIVAWPLAALADVRVHMPLHDN